MITKYFTVDSNVTNSNAFLRSSRLLAILQDTTVELFEQSGIGYHSAKDKGLMWVVTKYQIEIIEMPEYLDRLKIELWANEPRHNIYKICFKIYRDETEIIDGFSNWLLLDHDTHNIQTGLGNVLQCEDKTSNIKNVMQIKRFKDDYIEKKSERTALWSMCDMNHHMNNTMYLDVCEDMIDTDFLENNVVKAIQIFFRKEISMGETFEVLCQRQKNEFFFEGKNDGERFVARMVFDTTND